ncbi:DUF427 domain-containing protein [Herbidospora mongoliensis]|uniref:DUF427 domain-containing protein n=1 Tax=Herbidospora mongoliensis TaxID=688067 RepID=UPI000831F929|nr:DUF427 domain-containing protein [Herbidospora mongoliensis]
MPYDGTFNWEPSRRWVRGVRGGTTVVDSKAPVLVWGPDHPVPAYAFPISDVSGLTGASDLTVEGETSAGVVSTYPELPDHVSIAWFRYEGTVLDHWYEEEEEIFVHPRDPYKRVDPIPSSRHVRVEIGGRVVADTRNPVLLYETGLPTRYYVPPGDVDFALLEPTDSGTRCPYKGEASYWSLREPVEGVPADVAWAYHDPIPAAAGIKDHVAFYNEFVDIIVDGVKEDRPETVFSKR